MFTETKLQTKIALTAYDSSVLLSALNEAAKFCDHSVIQPLYSHIHCEISDNKITVNGTDGLNLYDRTITFDGYSESFRFAIDPNFAPYLKILNEKQNVGAKYQFEDLTLFIERADGSKTCLPLSGPLSFRANEPFETFKPGKFIFIPNSVFNNDLLFFFKPFIRSSKSKLSENPFLAVEIEVNEQTLELTVEFQNTKACFTSKISNELGISDKIRVSPVAFAKALDLFSEYSEIKMSFCQNNDLPKAGVFSAGESSTSFSSGETRIMCINLKK